MQLSEKGLKLIKRSEGYRSHEYLDCAGLRTIGYGHRLAPTDSYPNGIEEYYAETLLAADVFCAENAVKRFVTVPLTQGQFDALVDFVFNLGSSRLRHSTLLADLNKGLYAEAARQLLLWDHSGMRIVEGLKERREAEFNLWNGKAA